ncbi:MAG: c-type cytochrome [Myxococcales bacterium]|nr:c-type cytochrome [Myxococcales bacterium]
MTAALLLATLAACGEAPPPPPAAPPPKAAEAPPPPVPAAPPTGPYTADPLAQAAYDAARAAGADAKTNPKAGDAAASAAGRLQYEKCQTCHGTTGAGDGIAAAALPQKPAQFTWDERWAATSVGTKHWAVVNGIAGTSMGPLGLSEDQAWEVLTYIEAELRKK